MFFTRSPYHFHCTRDYSNSSIAFIVFEKSFRHSRKQYIKLSKNINNHFTARFEEKAPNREECRRGARAVARIRGRRADRGWGSRREIRKLTQVFNRAFRFRIEILMDLCPSSPLAVNTDSELGCGVRFRFSSRSRPTNINFAKYTGSRLKCISWAPIDPPPPIPAPNRAFVENPIDDDAKNTKRWTTESVC